MCTHHGKAKDQIDQISNLIDDETQWEVNGPSAPRGTHRNNFDIHIPPCILRRFSSAFR